MNEETKIHAAMAAAFAEMPGVERDGRSNFGSYTTLGKLVATIRPVLAKHGLFFVQQPEMRDDGVGIKTTVHSSDGGVIDCGCVFVPAGKANAHGIGSAITYAKRYGLAAAFGVSDLDDDDGHAAVASTNGEKPNGTRRAVKPATGKQAFVTAIRAATGITDNNDIAAFASKVCGKLGIDKAKATDDEWAKATAEVEANAQNIMEWAG
jgi:hypothetical protein